MSLPSADSMDTVMLSLKVKLTQPMPVGIAESLEDGVVRAIQILTSSTRFRELAESSESVARLIVSQTRPGVLMLEDRIARLATMKEILEKNDWLTSEDINRLQTRPPQNKSLPANVWKRRGRIFSVLYDGKEYFPRYQFDAMYQPLPIIRDILKAFGKCPDNWSLAAWFHFPNGWIAKEVGNEAVPIAPKEALGRSTDVINAARNQTSTYFA